MEEAKADLSHAFLAHRAGGYNWACFAAEQAAEKSLKAFLIAVLKKRPIHVHDLTILHRETSGRLKLPRAIVDRLGELSSYYTLARYPNSGMNRPSLSITSTQSKRALWTARRTVDFVKSEIAKAS